MADRVVPRPITTEAYFEAAKISPLWEGYVEWLQQTGQWLHWWQWNQQRWWWGLWEAYQEGYRRANEQWVTAMKNTANAEWPPVEPAPAPALPVPPAVTATP